MKRFLIIFGFLALTLGNVCAQSVDWSKVKILVYTKNGEGFVHDNIANSVEALQALATKNGFKADVTDDPNKFTDENLKQYNVLVFSNTNNNVFDTDAQKVAFRHFIEAGGSFVGLHSASGTERKWSWFKQLLGGTFLFHEPRQRFEVKILDKTFPAVQKLPNTWVREDDELYYLKEMSVNLNVVAVNDITTLPKPGKTPHPDTFGKLFPSVWHHEFDGGRAFYSSLGHNKEDYQQEDLRQHILGAIEWAVREQKPLDYSKAYAKTSNDPVPAK